MTLEEPVNKVKELIIADIKAGTVPETVKTFSELHDYVDANEYLIAALPDKSPIAGDDVDDSFINTANQIADTADKWLREGRKC
jgi:hypothetical protein